MTTASKLSLAVVALLAIGATTAQAQTANISATATVQTALTVTAGGNLAYGAVFPGAGNRTIAPNGAGAGTFTLAGQAGAEVSMTFVLPATLTGPGAPMVIGTWTGNHNNTASPTGTAFTPSGASTLAILDASTGNRFVYIGATLTVPAVQTAGAYSGTITLNALYTGN